jgi:hypothetical protein
MTSTNDEYKLFIDVKRFYSTGVYVIKVFVPGKPFHLLV